MGVDKYNEHYDSTDELDDIEAREFWKVKLIMDRYGVDEEEAKRLLKGDR